MTAIETLIYCIIFGVLSFVIGYLLVGIPAAKQRYQAARYSFGIPDKFDIKNAANPPEAEQTQSSVDQVKALDDYAC